MAASISVRTYLIVFVSLMVLTVVTVLVALVDLGPLNDPLAMGIAGSKTVLVVLFFMHAWESPRLIQVIIVASLLWLTILIGFVMADVLTRPQIEALPSQQASWNVFLTNPHPHGQVVHGGAMDHLAVAHAPLSAGARLRAGSRTRGEGHKNCNVVVCVW